MGIQFEPKSEEQLKKAMLAPDGDYDFEVLEAWDQVSKKGNAMIKLNLGIFRGSAMSNRVYDYITPALESKLRHFCDSTGLLAKYESGGLTAADCKGRAGKVRLVIEQKDPQYPPQNKVTDYICRQAKPLVGALPDPNKEEDDVPF